MFVDQVMKFTHMFQILVFYYEYVLEILIILIEEIELWKNQKNRFHDRIKFTRKIRIENESINAEKRWNSVRIQP